MRAKNTLVTPKLLHPFRRVIFTLACLLLSAVQAVAQEADFRYVVQLGDNPWNITERYLKSINYWPRIQAYNQITSPTTIAPGTVLRIPVAWMRGESVSARVTDVRGQVTAEQHGEITLLARGMSVAPGALIRTGADSSFTLSYPDGGRTLVGANAEVRLETLQKLNASGAQQVELELRRGEVDSAVRPSRESGGRFLIRTPAAVAAVRGTDFRAAAEPNRMRVETLDGEVSLGTRLGQTRLPAGAGSITVRNQRPEPASSLLPAPDLGGLPTLVERLPFELAIPPVEGAHRYRSQIAPDDGFSVLSSDLTLEMAAALGDATLPDGEYVLRVRAIDARGLEGRDAEHRLVVDARPEPPFPTAPADDAVASDEFVRFAWASVPGATAYHFELASDVQFAAPLIAAADPSEASYRLGMALEAGTYYWRIAVTTVDEGRGPFSDPQRFRRLEAGPEPEAAELGKGSLQLRWRDNPLATGYSVQISESEDFESLYQELELAEARFEIDTPPPGKYHVRIRHVEADGEVGPWGRPQSVEVPYNHWRALLILLPLLLL